MTNDRPDLTPPAPLRRLLLRALPEDDWSREFIAELDDEYRRRAARGRCRIYAALWYAGECGSRETIHFIWLMRRRRRKARRGEHERVAGGLRASPLEGWSQDFRQAARGLLREPRFALFVAATLAVGVGANAAMFGVADRLFLRGPGHVVAPEDLVRLYLRLDDRTVLGKRTTPWIPYRTAEAVREEVRAFAGLALYRTEEVLVQVRSDTRPLRVSSVDRHYFRTLGTTPALGRFFDGGSEDVSEDVAVLAHRVWVSDFAGDPSVLGRTIAVEGRTYTVIGVAPEGFTGPSLEPVDVWLPLDPAITDNRNWHVVGRLRPDQAGAAGAEAAAAEADAIHRRTDPGRFFQWARNGRIIAAPLAYDDNAAEPAEATISKLLWAVAALVLLIGVANVVNLMLARLTRRRREVAVRLALGVGRWRLARLMLSESLVLAALAGLASLPLAYGAGSLVRRVLLPQVGWSSSPLDWRVLGLTVLVALASALLVGLMPIWHASRTDVADGLRSGERAGGRRRASLHLSLAGGQVALSAVLLLGAGLFLESFRTIRVTDLGVDAGEVTAVTLRALEPNAIPSPSEREWSLYRRALDVVADDPDVAAAAASLGLPFLYNFGRSIVVPGIDSIPALPGGGPYLSAVTEGYFDAVGTSIVRGRDFTAAELSGGEPVMVVSGSMARRLWPGRDALGECVRVGDETSPCSRVIGVAEDVHRVGYREPPSMQYYVPLAPNSDFGGMSLVLRLRGRGAGALERIRSRLRRLDPAIAYVETQTLERVLDPQVRPWRLGAWVLGMAAVIALLVSLAGVYGVLSYLVEQRRREIGIRIALGATGAGIRGLVVRRGLGATALGLALSVGLVAAAAPWVQPMLFETSVLDPLVIGAVSAVLLAASVSACLLPANHASRVDPAVCLKEE
jgi:predicted permease